MSLTELNSELQEKEKNLYVIGNKKVETMQVNHTRKTSKEKVT